ASGNTNISRAAMIIIVGKILNTTVSCFLDSDVRLISCCTNAFGFWRYAFSNPVTLVLLVKNNPAPTAIKKMPATNNGHTKAFAIVVLPKYQKQAAANMKSTLNSQTTLPEKTSALAQS